MVQINNSRKIALWGTGLEAVRFMYSTDLDIDVVIDNNRVSEDWTFRGLPVKKTTELSNLKEYYIVMATSEGVYVQICEGLLSQGLEEFIDFCYCRHIGKKLAVLHGNCHVDVMKSFLGSSQKFNEEYAIYPLPSIYGIREGYIRGEILEHCDLFIHQDIRPDNSCGYKLSDEYVLPQVNVAAHKITVPNLFGYGSMFFPQVIGNPNNSWLFSGRDRNGMFPHGNKVIEKALEEGKSVEDIVRLLDSACISEDEIIENFAEEVSKTIGGHYYEDIVEATNDFDILWSLSDERISPVADTFDEVQAEYQRMINEGVSPEEINSAMITLFQQKRKRTCQ